METYIAILILAVIIISVCILILYCMHNKQKKSEPEKQNKYPDDYYYDWNEESRLVKFEERHGKKENWSWETLCLWDDTLSCFNVTLGLSLLRKYRNGKRFYRRDYASDEDFEYAIWFADSQDREYERLWRQDRAELLRQMEEFEAGEMKKGDARTREVERRELYEKMRENMIDDGWAADSERRRKAGQLPLTRDEFIMEIVSMRKNEETGIFESSLTYQHEASRFEQEGFPNPWELFRQTMHEKMALNAKINESEALREARKTAKPDLDKDAAKVKAIIATQARKRRQEDESDAEEGTEE